jgi:hypothetical protein
MDLTLPEQCQASSFEAAEEIVPLVKESADERIRYMAATWLYERAWGRAQDYDPNAERSIRGITAPKSWT